MNPRPDPEPTIRDLDPTSALLDQVLAASPGDQHALLELLSTRHPDCAADLRARFHALEGLGLLDGDEDDDGLAARGLAIPDEFGAYTLRERIGVGGMGVVYRAHQQSLGRDVALKLVRPDFAFFDSQRRRFRREAEAVARLDHPHIVPVFDLGEVRGIPYLAMQFVEGATLATLLRRLASHGSRALDGRALLDAMLAEVPTADSAAVTAAVRGLNASWGTVAASLMLPIADALAHAHARGILHRDVKPSNIMIASSGRALLLDFGLATRDGQAGSITRSGAFLGSLPYMAPEQIEGGPVDRRSDVFALGCVLYEVLTLRPAFEAASAEDTMSRIVWREPPDLRSAAPAVQPDLAAVVAKCLEKRPERRYQSPSDVASDLRAVLECRPVSAQALTPWVKLMRFCRREPLKAWAYAACVAALLVVSAATGYLAAQQEEIAAGRQKILAERIERDLSVAYLALWQGDSVAAKRAFSSALEAAPDRYEARCGLALARGEPLPSAASEVPPGVRILVRTWRESLADERRAAAALRDLQRAVNATPVARPLFHGHLARAAAMAEEEGTAREVAALLRSLWPKDAMSAVWAGYALIEIEPSRAAGHFADALELDSSLALAHAGMGNTCIQLGRPRDALPHLHRARELGLDNCKLLINLGVALWRSGQTHPSVEILREATRRSDAVPGAWYNLGVVLAESDPAAALRAFEHTVARDPGYADAWNNIGALQFAHGDFRRAARSFKRLTALRPQDALAYTNLGSALASAGNAQGAAAAYRRVVLLAPQDAEAHAYLCSLLEHLGDTESLAAERERFAAQTGREKKS